MFGSVPPRLIRPSFRCLWKLIPVIAQDSCTGRTFLVASTTRCTLSTSTTTSATTATPSLINDGNVSSEEEQEHNITQPMSSSPRSTSFAHQRVWPSDNDIIGYEQGTTTASSSTSSSSSYYYWTERVIDRGTDELHRLFQRLEALGEKSGRLKQHFWGVLHHDPVTDMQLLTDNYTVKAIASALRDREDALQYAAVLAEQGNWKELTELLRVFHPRFVLERRYGGVQQTSQDDITQSLQRGNLELIRKSLMRMPRTVTQGHAKRAGVVIALCTCNDGVPCVLLEKRSRHLRSHPDEVCLPGGMVCDARDRSIVNTCLREMREEILGLEHREPDVLGVLRCNWGEIHHMVNVAVTPVVCYWGELPEGLKPNGEEVAKVFTIPLASLVDKTLWVQREGMAPIFIGGPEVIWGLSGYILQRFAMDILLPIRSKIPDPSQAPSMSPEYTELMHPVQWRNST